MKGNVEDSVVRICRVSFAPTDSLHSPVRIDAVGLSPPLINNI